MTPQPPPEVLPPDGRCAADDPRLDDCAESTCLRLTGVEATLTALGPVRHRVAEFVAPLRLTAEAVADVVLASYEALANAVEHAYPADGPGTLDLCAGYDRGEDVLTVTVVDHGSWQPAEDTHRTRRGQGLRLIGACCDRSDVATGERGTRIRMQWECGGRRTPPPEPDQQVDQ